jgi:hypothetical protein
MSGRLFHSTNAKVQHRCEIVQTLKGGYCEERGEVRLDGLLLCERHARRVRLEEQVACWRAIQLHIELWSGAARSRGREDVVRLLEVERERATAALGRARKELERTEGEGGPRDGGRSSPMRRFTSGFRRRARPLSSRLRRP